MQSLLLSEAGHCMLKLKISDFEAASANICDWSLNTPATIVATTKRTKYIKRDDLVSMSSLFEEQNKEVQQQEQTLDAKQVHAWHAKQLAMLTTGIATHDEIYPKALAKHAILQFLI
jgi:hypothetical protein